MRLQYSYELLLVNLVEDNTARVKIKVPLRKKNIKNILSHFMDKTVINH